MTTPINQLAAFNGRYGGKAPSSHGINVICVPGKNGSVQKIQDIREEFAFFSVLGLMGVPVNRGTGEDITIKQINYIQYAADNNVSELGGNLASGAGVLHDEMGMFLQNPPSTVPVEAATVQRQGSLPHGVTFNAQGFITQITGPPTIPAMNTADAPTPNGITPFVPGPPVVLKPVPSASAADAAKFPAAILADPNKLLRDELAKRKVVSTTIVATDTHHPQIPGGGVTNSAFTLANAECIRQRSTFYVMKVAGFLGIQQDLIMYTQEVLLRFADGIIYPHITVAFLQRDPFPTPIVV